MWSDGFLFFGFTYFFPVTTHEYPVSHVPFKASLWGAQLVSVATWRDPPRAHAEELMDFFERPCMREIPDIKQAWRKQTASCGETSGRRPRNARPRPRETEARFGLVRPFFLEEAKSRMGGPILPKSGTT